jgi:hypothetical protein
MMDKIAFIQQTISKPCRKPWFFFAHNLLARHININYKAKKDRQCAEVNRQKIEGESPLSGNST